MEKDKKRTPEERARQLENQRRLQEVLERRLQQDGTTREEIWGRLGLPETSSVGKYKKRTPEERARQLENQRRLEQVLERRLQQDGLTRAEIEQRLGLPQTHRRGS